jgi:Flp pilus assembly protein TadG
MNLRKPLGLKSLRDDVSGNVAVLFALAAIPLFIGVGAAIDYARAAKVRGEVAAIADSAVLTGTTPAMLTQTAAAAKTAVQTMFAAQAQQINGLTYDATKLSVSVTDTQQTNTILRTVTLSYQAQVHNVFGAFDSRTATSFAIASSASTTSAPNIDFYMLLDSSPSMELPATTQGVSDMVSQTGCAFACHENNVSDGEYSHYSGWGTIDSYTYARNNGIALRIDNVRDAVNQVAASAQSTMAYNHASYRMAVYGFNFRVDKLQDLITTTSANQNNIQNSVANLVPPLMNSNNSLAGNQKYTYPTGLSTYATVALNSSALSNADAMTDFGQAMIRMNTDMPDPGNGTNQSGDTPQGVLMIVTDGVVDASLYSSTACSTTSNYTYSNSYGTFTRCMAPIDPSFCTTLKNRGIRIAVLYTTYQPVESNSWYVSKIKPFISQVSTNLQSCASPNLFNEVTTGDDIKTALTNLFQKAVTTAPRLTN